MKKELALWKKVLLVIGLFIVGIIFLAFTYKSSILVHPALLQSIM